MGTGIKGTFTGPRTRSIIELRDEVADFVQLPDSPRGQSTALRAIQSAVRRLNTREWWWNRTEHELTLVQGQFKYVVPMDYKRTISGRAFNVQDPPNQDVKDTDQARFQFLAPDVFDSQTRSTWSRWQEIFTVRNPSDERVLEFRDTMKYDLQSRYDFFTHRYWRNLMLPVDLSDALPCPSSTELFIVHYGQWEMARKFDMKRASEARSAYRESWAELRRDQKEQFTMTNKQGG